MGRQISSSDSFSAVAVGCILLAAMHVVHGEWWETMERKCSTVSVGQAGVWGTTEYNRVYYRKDSYKNWNDKGRSWQQVNGLYVSKVDVGNDIVFAISFYDTIYYRDGISASRPTGTSWKKVGGGDFRDVTVSPSGNVWAINTARRLNYRHGTSKSNPGGSRWESVPADYPESISAGSVGVWITTFRKDVFYRTGTYGDRLGNKGTGFQKVTGLSMRRIAVGTDVIAVDNNWTPHQRQGISASTPTGTGWKKLQTSFLVLSLDTHGLSLWTADPRSTQRLCHLDN